MSPGRIVTPRRQEMNKEARINELQHFLDAQGAENERLRWALEEIIQAAEPGLGSWVVIQDYLIEKARAALEPPKP